ncbi:MAG: hypothetical protein ACK4VO_03270 [Pseudobdellovibrio sp.]
MSRLDDAKEQLTTQLQAIAEKIQETQLYNQLNDRYQSLSSTGQKTVQITVIGLIVIAIIYSPMSQLANSKTLVSEFESKRALIRDLFKAYRDSSTTAQIQPAPSSSDLISQVQNALNNARLIPEQVLAVSTAQPDGKLIPQNLILDVVEVKLSKLNLRQIVDIGTKLTNISDAVKVKDMVIKAHSELKGYFDVQFKLFALKVPEALPEPPPDIPEPKKKKKNDQNDESNE